MSGTDPIEFVDPEDGEGVDWLDEEPLEAAHSGRLTLTTRNRAAASLLTVAALILAGTTAARVVYRHDQSVTAAADTLVLTQSSNNPVALPYLAVLDIGSSWTWRPRTEVEITLVNQSPDEVTLLPGATLTSLSQIDGAATLAPVGQARLAPGQIGHLAGEAVLHCNADEPDALLTLTVRARTASGAVATTAMVISHGPTVGTIAEQACHAQAPKMASWSPAMSVDAHAHTFTLSLTATSQADVPLVLGADPQYLNVYPTGTYMGSDIEPALPGVTLDRPTYTGDITGDDRLAPGRRLTVAYTVHVATCPATGPVPEEGWQFQLSVTLSVDDSFASIRSYAGDLSSLVSAACGLAR